MSRASPLVRSWLDAAGASVPAASISLAHSDAHSLRMALQVDADDLMYSACASISGAIHASRAKHFSWATVGLYYAVFYTIRAYVAHQGIAVVYHKRKPLWLKAVAGASPVKERGTSHEAAAAAFRKTNPRHPLLSQEIDLMDPIDWLKGRREYVNYGLARFSDPGPPKHFEILAKYGLRRLIETYTSEPLAFAFDPDHAMLAYPLAIYRSVYDSLVAAGHAIAIEQYFVRDSCRDDAGPFASLVDHLAP